MKYIILLCFSMTAYHVNAQNVGIGTSSPAQKLDVVGNVKVSGAIMPNGVAGNDGQVLVSGGAGNPPTWQTLSSLGSSKFMVLVAANSNSSGRMGFSATSGTNQTDSIDLSSVRYEVGSDFSIITAGTTNNSITVNSDGLYHLEGLMRYTMGHSSVQGLFPSASLTLVYDPPPAGSPIIQTLEDHIRMLQTTSTSIYNYNLGLRFSFDYYFTAGTSFTFEVGIANLTNFPLFAVGVTTGYISGYKISD